MTKLLIYRFSAMGDVVLLLPVLKGLLASNSDIEIYLLTQPGFSPLFKGIERLHLVGADLKGQHKGFAGLFRLFRQISREVRPHRVFDLHGVLRSFVLDFFFLTSGYRVTLFDKGGFQKRQAIKTKSSGQLLSTIERYRQVFVVSGYRADLPELPLFTMNKALVLPDSIAEKSILIGIAPFAKHRQKIWGIKKIEELIERLVNLYNPGIVLFGGGKSEMDLMEQLAEKYPNCIVSARYFDLSGEISLMGRLSAMVSMDSANMHLASMAGTPTISIWGATHPALGFAPYRQPIENIIQYSGNQLTCRPCSVFGNKQCIYTDGPRCMEYISVQMVLDRINQLLAVSSVLNR